VAHENRGLVTHIKDVVRRVATAGFSAVAVDLLSRQGGADKLSDPAEYAAALSKQDPMAMVSDLQQALSVLSAAGPGDRLGITGFCFGGGMTWNALAAGTAVKAAVPFYGPPPKNLAGLATTKAAVLAIYAERDTRITRAASKSRDHGWVVRRHAETGVFAFGMVDIAGDWGGCEGCGGAADLR
jgi:carboxymethylenebutenolidase